MGQVSASGIGKEKQLNWQSNGSGAAEHRIESVPGLITLSPHHKMCLCDTQKSQEHVAGVHVNDRPLCHPSDIVEKEEICKDYKCSMWFLNSWTAATKKCSLWAGNYLWSGACSLQIHYFFIIQVTSFVIIYSSCRGKHLIIKYILNMCLISCVSVQIQYATWRENSWQVTSTWPFSFTDCSKFTCRGC